MSIGARLRLGGDAPSAQGQLFTELTRAGLAVELDPHRAGRGQPNGSCLLVFDRLTDEVLAEVRDAGARGRQRVLAIALAGAALDSSEAWSLLRSGASDVVRWDERNPPARDVAARLQRWAEVDRILGSDVVRQRLTGDSPARKRTGGPADSCARPVPGQEVAGRRGLYDSRTDARAGATVDVRAGPELAAD